MYCYDTNGNSCPNYPSSACEQQNHMQKQPITSNTNIALAEINNKNYLYQRILGNDESNPHQYDLYLDTNSFQIHNIFYQLFV